MHTIRGRNGLRIVEIGLRDRMNDGFAERIAANTLRSAPEIRYFETVFRHAVELGEVRPYTCIPGTERRAETMGEGAPNQAAYEYARFLTENNLSGHTADGRQPAERV